MEYADSWGRRKQQKTAPSQSPSRYVMSKETGTTYVSPIPDDENLYKQAVKLLLEAHGGKTLFNVKEAAEILRMSEDFIRRKVSTGDICATRLGDRITIHISEIARIQLEGLS
jgi:excisionase family DNA binding protein